MLQKSVELIEARHSISAEVTYFVDLFDKKLAGKGFYCEERSGPHPLVRFESKTPAGDSESYLLQVSDGKYLWIYHLFMDDPRLDRIDLVRLSTTVAKRCGAGQGGTGLNVLGPIDATALGGMAGLLLSLQESFVFDSAESETLYDTPVWKIRGRWNPARLAIMFPELSNSDGQGRGAVDLSRLPSRMPDHVLVRLGKDDLFPYRIEYCRGEDDGENSRTIMAVQLYRVSFNLPLDKSNFQYKPGGVPVADRTQEYIDKITRRINCISKN